MGTNKRAQSELIPGWHQPWSWGSCGTIQSKVNRLEHNATAKSRLPLGTASRREARHQSGRI
jgi:hypothetical protein